MALRVKTVVIEEEGRDFGKHFVLTEMPAHKAEKWAARALNALLASGMQLPDSTASMGLAGVASMGLSAFSGLPWDQVEPLLDEMFTCVKYLPDPQRESSLRAIIDAAGDIEEVMTRLTLRREVLELHLGFSLAEKLSTSAVKTRLQTGSSTMPTSPD